MYDPNLSHQLEIERRLATIEEHLINSDKNMERRFAETDKKLDTIISEFKYSDRRILALEQWRTVIKSNITLVGAIVSALITIVTNFIMRKFL